MSHGRPRRRWASAGAVGFACLLLASSAAGATWSEPITVSPADQYVEDPRVAMDDRGDVAVAWQQSIDSYNSAIQVSLKPAGGSFSAPIELPHGPGQNLAPQVALGHAGEVIVVWQSEDGTRKVPGQRVMFASGSMASGAFSAPTAISPEGASEGGEPLGVGLDEHGEALAVWQGREDQIQYATRAPGTASFSVPSMIANPGLSLSRPGIAIASNGSAVVAWTGWVEKETNGKSWRGAFAAVRDAGGAFRPAQTLEVAPCMYNDYVDTAINDAGQAVVSWTAEKPECESVITDGVRASYRAPSQGFQSPASIPSQTLGLAGGDAVSPSGTVTISGTGTNGSDSLVALRRMPDGSYGDREVIFQGQSYEYRPTLASDAAGNVYAATDTRTFVPGPPSEPADAVPVSGIVANVAAGGGGFAPEGTSLQMVQGELDFMPVLATAGDGQAVVVWATGLVNRRFRAEVSMWQPEGPALTPAPPTTPEGGTPPPPLKPIQPTSSSGEASGAPSPGVALQPPTTTTRGSIPTTTGNGPGVTPQTSQLVVRGRAGRRASGVMVRLLRGGVVLRTVQAHISRGHFRAILNTAGLPSGRYRMQILLRREGRKHLEQRWISLG